MTDTKTETAERVGYLHLWHESVNPNGTFNRKCALTVAIIRLDLPEVPSLYVWGMSALSKDERYSDRKLGNGLALARAHRMAKNIQAAVSHGAPWYKSYVPRFCGKIVCDADSRVRTFELVDVLPTYAWDACRYDFDLSAIDSYVQKRLPTILKKLDPSTRKETPC